VNGSARIAAAVNLTATICAPDQYLGAGKGDQHRQATGRSRKELEELGYTFAAGDWMHPADD
jgi:hypothetical protein